MSVPIAAQTVCCALLPRGHTRPDANRTVRDMALETGISLMPINTSDIDSPAIDLSFRQVAVLGVLWFPVDGGLGAVRVRDVPPGPRLRLNGINQCRSADSAPWAVPKK